MVKGRSSSGFIDEATKVVEHEVPKKKSRREIIHEEVKEKEEKKYYKTEKALEKKLPKKRIPLFALYEYDCKIKLEYALEYYKNEFPLLKFNAEGEELGSEIKLKTHYDAWTLLLPINIHKDVMFSLTRTRVTYITGEEILETMKEHPKYSEIIKKYITNNE